MALLVSPILSSISSLLGVLTLPPFSYSAPHQLPSTQPSWCFRTISEFITKATGYSHTDRLGSRPSAILRPSNIQETICTGSDFFHMLPEAYSWREMVSKWRLLA